MRDADYRSIAPESSCPSEQLSSLLAIETTKRFIENDELHTRPEHSSPETHSLSFTTGDQSPSLAERCLQTVGQSLEHASQFCRLYYLTYRQRGVCRRT